MKKDNENLTVCININNSLAKIMKIFFLDSPNNFQRQYPFLDIVYVHAY